jgi:hypothetical protein
MRTRRTIKSILPALLTALALATPASGEQWQSTKGTYTELFYTDISVVKRFNGNLSLRWLRYQAPRGDASDLSAAGAATDKMDAIWVNVERILNIYPRGPLVGVYAHGHKEYGRQYEKLAHTPAFYAKLSKRVVVNSDRVRTNVLAHEFAHAIIDMHMGPSVPDTVQEILAKYVDAHLYD